MTDKLHYILLIFMMHSCACISQSDDAQKWENIQTETAPIARHENSFVAIGKNFYLLGGRGIKPISIYHIDTNKWTTGAAPEVEIHHFQGVAYNNKVYVIGAMTGKYPYETPLATMLIYDPATNIWETGPEIPKERRRGSCGIVVDGDSVYMVSGIVDGHNSTHVPWVDRYDFKTGKWTVLADAPRARDHFQAAIGNGKIYAVGGRNSSFATKQTFELTIKEVDIYDIKNNTWTTLKESGKIPTQRAGTTTVFYQNKLIVIGGESSSQESAHNQIETLNLKTMEWSTLPSLNSGRHGTQAIVHNDAIYIVAGCGNRGGRPELNSMEKYYFED